MSKIDLDSYPWDTARPFVQDALTRHDDILFGDNLGNIGLLGEARQRDGAIRLVKVAVSILGLFALYGTLAVTWIALNRGPNLDQIKQLMDEERIEQQQQQTPHPTYYYYDNKGKLERVPDA